MEKIDLREVSSFLATHARLLDRRRFALTDGKCAERAVASALAAYRNSDGGYGALEPDLRSTESQPAGALHAFEVFAEIGAAAAGTHPTELGDWLAAATLPDGGLPFALPVTDPAGCAWFWVQADPTRSSLHITAAVTAVAHRAARRHEGVRDHPWLARATDYCWRRIRELDTPESALELRYALQFLDAAYDALPGAANELRRLGAFLPASGVLPVEGGAPDEALRPLDFAPEPNRPVRALFSAEAIAADLDRLAGGQQADGGWTVDFASASPAAALEWRGYQTVAVVEILRANDVL